MNVPFDSKATLEAPFRALCGTEAWPESALAHALEDVDSRGRRLRRIEAWAVFEDGTYAVFILLEGGARRMYSWEPTRTTSEADYLREGCLEFAGTVARDAGIHQELRARLRFALFTEGSDP